MIIVLKKKTEQKQLHKVLDKIAALGSNPHVVEGRDQITISLIGNTEKISLTDFGGLEGIESVVRISKPYKLAAIEARGQRTVLDVGGCKIGDGHFVSMAGPCSVESREQTLRIAREVKKSGAQFLRGGAFKPRSSPYSFQGLGKEGLDILKEARDETGLLVISEAMDSANLNMVAEYVDIVQVGARNMQNFSFLKDLGQIKKPVMLKRGMSATIEEWLMAAEYIMAQGNDQVILCERGIRTFDNKFARNTLDLNAVPVLRQLTHLPIIVDPSHGTGLRHLVSPMALASMAAGADGVIVEVHDRPQEALSDGPQALLPS
ncbi:MAG: 3-deoxy-7-phosphoheptulonate synthase, partial [Bdellovibrionales bacterium]|nr:3-deoxy-7-phosphoheptulonate synthase [Bdellovibrionales bacterium]